MVLGINPGPDPLADLEVFVDAFQITFPILLDDGGVMAGYRQVGAISPFPLDYIIDRDGNVAYFSTEYDPATMVAVIDDLLATEVGVDDGPVPPPGPVLQASPNPFNPSTTISFDLPQPGAVALRLYDTRGRMLRTLMAGRHHDEGRHAIRFDGVDDRGQHLPSGSYLLRLQAGDQTTSGKLMLVR